MELCLLRFMSTVGPIFHRSSDSLVSVTASNTFREFFRFLEEEIIILGTRFMALKEILLHFFQFLIGQSKFVHGTKLE